MAWHSQPKWQAWVEVAKEIAPEAKHKNDPNQAWCDFFEAQFGLAWKNAWDKRIQKETDWISLREQSEYFTHLLDWHFAFNEGNPNGMLQFFRNAEKIPKTWEKHQLGEMTSSTEDANNSLQYSMHHMELYHTLSYNPENVLAMDYDHRTLSFLFLFYHPFNTNSNMLFHYQEKAPLITFPQISKNHFDMLLYLTKHETPDEWVLMQQNFNLNHQLIARFIDNMQPVAGLYRGAENINWIQMGMPAEKIKALLKAGFSLNDFEKLRNDRTWLTFSSMAKNVEQLIAEAKEEEMRDAIFQETKEILLIQEIKKI